MTDAPDTAPGQPGDNQSRDYIDFIEQEVAKITDGHVEGRLRDILLRAGYRPSAPDPAEVTDRSNTDNSTLTPGQDGHALMRSQETARVGVLTAVGIRDRIIAHLALVAEVADGAGMASTRLAEAVGYTGSSVAFAQVLSGMERDGLISREVRGERTYRIALSAPSAEEPVLLAAGDPVLPAGATMAIRAAVHAELDEVLPYVVEALRRNNALDELSDRLRTAERRIESRRERPVIIGLHQVLDRIRHLEFDEEVRRAIDEDLMRVLVEAGYQETGQAGEDYDPTRHDAIDGRALDGKAVVTRVHSRGLTSFSDVVVRAKVEISPAPDSANTA